MIKTRQTVSKLVMIFAFLITLCVTIQVARAETIFKYDFEEGWGNWYSDNGVWEIGTPTVGPSASYGGTQCAGTVLSGDYPSYTDSRLISPTITLSTVSGDEELALRFWHWFSYSSKYNPDYGYTQISTYDSTSGTWSDWETIGSTIQNVSGAWSSHKVNITSYAGKKVRIAFYHTADGSYQGSGWYIDDVHIVKKVSEFTGDFELGWGDWYSDNGVWEIGTPTVGPSASYGGTQCAGTVLSGDYPSYTDSRLISPTITLSTVSGDEELALRFWHWFSYSSKYNPDYGYTQISTYDSTSGTWSDWETIGSTIQNVSGAWSSHKVNITSYAGKKVRIAFYHTADGNYQGSGWYIDDVEITGINTSTTPTPIPSTTPALPPTVPPVVTPSPSPVIDTGAITGWVLEATTLGGISGATVSTNPGGYSALTDASGYYTIENIPPDTYTVTATASGYNSSSQSGITIYADETETVNFHLQLITYSPTPTPPTPPPPSPTPIPPATPSLGTGYIIGSVIDNDTRIVMSGVIVTTDNGGYSATTGTNGSYLMTVDAGIYTVTASANGYESASRTITVEANSITTANFNLELIKGPTGFITGTVSDADTGKVIEGVTVTTDASGYTATTDKGGVYQLTVSTGEYTMTATANGYKTALEDVTVVENVIATVNFSLTPVVELGVIFGSVEDEYGDPFQGVEVTLSGDSYIDESETDEDGDYAFYDVSAGDYTLSFKAKGYGTEELKISIEEGEIYEAKTIEMEPENDGLGIIYGFVYDIYGDPIESAKVKIKGVETGESDKEYTDGDGYFEFYDMDSGTYKISANKKRYKKTKTTVSLKSGQEKYVEMELRKSSKSRSDNVEVDVVDSGIGL